MNNRTQLPPSDALHARFVGWTQLVYHLSPMVHFHVAASGNVTRKFVMDSDAHLGGIVKLAHDPDCLDLQTHVRNSGLLSHLITEWQQLGEEPSFRFRPSDANEIIQTLRDVDWSSVLGAA